MIGVVLVAHGRLAQEFRAALEHVVGPQDQLDCVAIGPDDDMEERRADIVRSVKAVDKGAGAIIVTDMFGGTPSNLAISIMDESDVDVVAGMNLPLLIKIAKMRADCPVAEVVQSAADAGRKYIKVARELLDGQ